MNYTDFVTSDGSKIVVETEDIGADLDLAGSGLPKQGSQKLKSVLESVKPAAEDFVEALSDLTRKPDELEISFGLKLNGEVGALIAKTSSEANISIKIKWSK